LDTTDRSGILKLLENFRNKNTSATGPLQDIKDGFKEVNAAYQDLTNSLVNNDPLSKFGAALIKQSNILEEAFKDPTNALKTLNSIMQDTSQIRAFPPESQRAILEVARKYEEVTLNIKQYKAQIEAGRQLQKEALTDIGSGIRTMVTGGEVKIGQGARMESDATRLLTQSEQKLKDLNNQIAQAITSATQRGFELIQGPLSRAITQASIDSQKTLLGYLPKSTGSIELSNKLELQSINLKIEELKSQRELTNTIKLDTIARSKEQLQTKIKEVGEFSVEGGRLKGQIKDLELQEKAILDPTSISKGSRLSAGIENILQESVGYQTKLTELLSQQSQIRLKGVVDKSLQAIDTAIQRTQDSLNDLKKANEDYYKDQKFLGLSGPEQAREQAKRASQEQELGNVVAGLQAAKPAAAGQIVSKLGGSAELRGLGKSALESAQERQAVLLQQQESTKQITDQLAKATQFEKEVTGSVEKQLQALEGAASIRGITAQLETESLNAASQKLDFDLSTGKISQDQYTNQKRLNDLKQVDLELSAKLADLNDNYLKQTLQIAKQAAAPGLTADQRNALIAQSATNAETYRTGLEAAKQSAQLKAESVVLLSSIDERTKTYSDAFNNTVNSMSDALVDFAMTGKASFGDMIQSMILDLIKFEQRQMMMAAYQGMGGSGGVLGALGSIAGSVGASLFGPSTATAGELANFGGYGSANSGLGAVQPDALGGVYNQGRMAFAKGGTFTNTIVTRPTTFAFAKGAGLMGESGPEAIMPLKRGANGSLGIQGGGGGNVDVVVNNYGQEKATTKETTDSRGNRRIEVIVGEMTAAEMSRPNSPIQTSMRGTFGIAPQLTRR
jgi:hypothetical protein